MPREKFVHSVHYLLTLDRASHSICFKKLENKRCSPYIQSLRRDCELKIRPRKCGTRVHRLRRLRTTDFPSAIHCPGWCEAGKSLARWCRAAVFVPVPVQSSLQGARPRHCDCARECVLKALCISPRESAGVPASAIEQQWSSVVRLRPFRCGECAVCLQRDSSSRR